MKTLEEFLAEAGADCPPRDKEISNAEFNSLEKKLDALFDKLGIDIAFTKHFKERVNDERNGKQITQCELATIYVNIFKKFGAKIGKTSGERDIEKIIKSFSTNINIPVVMKYDRRKKEVVMVAKTAMRKRGFKHREPAMQVENENT